MRIFTELRVISRRKLGTGYWIAPQREFDGNGNTLAQRIRDIHALSKSLLRAWV
ncbi:hypothetical protein [Methylococcus mesophilus]|uniref:hypothetical protein n=1 Tax=Methylococcus mesophilus TaxID=2993564 RepID=UPI00224A9737|nr:hypothetical protein [Methylococcus mesophilus]UZR28776.1 hypothetical protein OOT43_19030 [Methylococcus mesophilus]